MEIQIGKISNGIILFAVYNFLLTMTLQINDKVALPNPGQHYLGTFMLGLGFLLFYIGRIIFSDAGKRRLSVISAVLIYIASILIRIFDANGIHHTWFLGYSSQNGSP